MKIYSQNNLNELANILKHDGIISVPTDTVYGLCAKMNSKIAHDNLVKIKNRPSEKLFPIMCSDIKQINEIAIINSQTERIINSFMPGPITLVLLKKPGLQPYINNNQATIAIRMAPSKEIRNLIDLIGCPLFMTSANPSGMPPCNNIKEIQKFLPNIDGILEGNISKNKASTILDCTANTLKILREGPITLEQINKKIY